ncbi:hypothetical protein COW38_00780 [Candidatus Collierbacteria bacterium CG17_big_fil_post_rev_8_21_14_2_50_45_7]|uniref:AAA+ ATPase domain-containing protein n=2 Tax=Candidatus Collieribacteriota TaxID=1752725 RepID=A0A2H0WYX0_9BACT|nr:MAG: hypothetical protein COT54_02780 [Candidatus Collierbacteria bacterium CG09_land_8_20_14_0_10_46_12]PIW08448.1 MAG: hypothetical protein COW38_00780 [Candidatus Collierbacteria bacterium CG17_big_fil_post_rev_8_21_14_2_50_45_7]
MVVMFKRTLELSLVKWKNDSVHKPIILRGARQVGKTSMVRQFGKKNFRQLIEINLENQAQRKVFQGVLDIEDFERRLALVRGERMETGKLLFIDEIQELREMMELLRFFAEERPGWHVIVTGSLLEAKMGGKWSVPVGRVDYRSLFPLTFFEFLGAMGKDKLLSDLQDLKMGEKYPYHDLAKQVFGQYVLLGGMPEVIANFAEKQDYGRAREVLQRLQIGYVDDVAKYTKNEQEKKYLEAVVTNGAREGGKIFRYENFAGTDFHSREMSSAVARVEKTMLCHQVAVINSTILPMNLKLRRPKKMIWLDIGLVNLVNEYYGEIIQGDYSGRVMEQVVGQALLADLSSTFNQLVYFARDRDESSAEVDFCFINNSKLVAMEVKAGKTTTSRSLQGLMKDPLSEIVPVLVSWQELGIDRGMIKIPFYLLARWREFIGRN